MKSHQDSKSLSLLGITVPYLFAIGVMMVAAVCVVYRFASDKAYNEKWKEYNDCGLA